MLKTVELTGGGGHLALLCKAGLGKWGILVPVGSGGLPTEN